MLRQTFQQLFESPALTIALWLALALIAMLVVALRPRRVLLSSGETGSLRISRHALHKLIEAVCEQVKGVATARARVSGRAGNLSTRIRLKIHPAAKLDAIRSYLAQEVASIYRNNLGIANEGLIEIEVIGIVPEDKPL